MTVIKKSDFTKWLALAFPYFASLLFELVKFISSEIIKIPLEENTLTTIFLLINSFSVLLGIKVLTYYTHTDNCKNYRPKNYTH